MKEHFAEVETGKRLRQTPEGTFRLSRYRREDVLLKLARERTGDKGFFANTHELVHHILCSYIPFGGTPYREMHQNTSGVVLWLF